MNVISNKFAMAAASLILALGVMMTSAGPAQAHHRDKVIAGVIAGVAIAAILSSRHRHRRHYYGYHKHRPYYHRYNRYRPRRWYKRRHRHHRIHRRYHRRHYDYW